MENLESLCLSEMNLAEMHSIEGGVLPPWLVPTTVALAIYLYDNRERFVEGVSKIW
jgi:putative effector of murein hydrolase